MGAPDLWIWRCDAQIGPSGGESERVNSAQQHHDVVPTVDGQAHHSTRLHPAFGGPKAPSWRATHTSNVLSERHFVFCHA
jgi:hypothetical protein